tara:strand:- start:62 stop:385 length:324 start_codon:yes stop_codon:yes gene_type:complete
VSNIQINTGGGTTVSGITTTTSSVAVKQPSINVSVGGVIGGGDDANYVHSQEMVSDTWTVNHNLNKYPSVTIVDSGDNVLYTEIEYIDVNTLEVRFEASTSGKAYIN